MNWRPFSDLPLLPHPLTVGGFSLPSSCSARYVRALHGLGRGKKGLEVKRLIRRRRNRTVPPPPWDFEEQEILPPAGLCFFHRRRGRCYLRIPYSLLPPPERSLVEQPTFGFFEKGEGRGRNNLSLAAFGDIAISPSSSFWSRKKKERRTENRKSHYPPSRRSTRAKGRFLSEKILFCSPLLASGKPPFFPGRGKWKPSM